MQDELPAAHSEEKARVLVVEDEYIVASDIRVCLTNLGYTVVGIATSGQEALDHAEREKPDLILMDIVLQGGADGIETAGTIRERMHIPVIYLTAYDDETMLQRAKVTEPMGYLIKPFEERELYFAIEMAIYKHRMEMRLRESERRFRSLVDNAADAFLVFDVDGDLKDVSRVACKVLGYTRQELLGMTIQDVFKSNAPMDVARMMAEAKGGRVIAIEGKHAARDASTLDVEMRMVHYLSEGRDLLLALSRDITERNLLVEELRGALQKVQTLKSTVPICALKKQASSQRELEAHIKSHHDAIFKNGVCAECLDVLKRDIMRSK